MKTLVKIGIIIIAAGLMTQTALAQSWDRIINLKGYWKFSIGDDMSWADPFYNDEDWEEIKVPSYWEDEGFYGYNGYAWYRIHFRFPEDFKGQMVYLELGAIDDIDEAYLNGKLVGFSGQFPPNYQTAYFAWRRYPVPVYIFKKNQENVLAIRVYDAELGGGMANGNIGIYYRPNSLSAEINLEGEWKFRAGDNKEWKNKNVNEKEWNRIIVPGYWESQGFKDYDGFGWYRKVFKVPEKLKGKKLVLMLGKIDDLDEAYLNGQLIGSTGIIRDDAWKNEHSQEYSQFRGYYLPDGLVKYNEENVLAVRVYDGYINGGIYEGPIGLISQERYTKFWRKNKGKKNIFELIFE